MKITDALLAEHVVFHTRFDHISYDTIMKLGKRWLEHRAG
jgi:hypothetical protein